MKTMRKLGAILLAIMVIAMVGAAWADVDPDLGSYEGSNNRGWGISNGNKIPITKSIIIFNPENTTVREPNIQFVYTVTSVTDTNKLGTITDDGRYNNNNPVTVKVNAGVDGVITGVTVPFGETNTVSAKSTGTEAEHTGNLTVNLSNITHAGVYRYLITETIQNLSGTAITDITTYGLEARTNNYDTTRYLDLYVSNITDSSETGYIAPGGSGYPALKVTGAIIFKVNSVDNAATPNNAHSAITVTTDKTTGFEPGTSSSGSDPDYTTDDEVDRYFTYNLQVGKTTTGALADMIHDFPFEIKLTAASTLVPTVITDLTVTGATNETAGVRNIANGTVLTLSPKMSDGDFIELKGIPKGTTVTVKETNDTPDTYTASWNTMVGTTTSNAAVKGYTSSNNEKNDLALANTDYAKNTTAVAIDGGQTTSYVETVLGYTNNLAEISPTGYVTRFAPYALILIGGVALLVIAMKRRKHTEED